MLIMRKRKIKRGRRLNAAVGGAKRIGAAVTGVALSRGRKALAKFGREQLARAAGRFLGPKDSLAVIQAISEHMAKGGTLESFLTSPGTVDLALEKLGEFVSQKADAAIQNVKAGSKVVLPDENSPAAISVRSVGVQQVAIGGRQSKQFYLKDVHKIKRTKYMISAMKSCAPTTIQLRSDKQDVASGINKNMTSLSACGIGRKGVYAPYFTRSPVIANTNYKDGNFYNFAEGFDSARFLVQDYNKMVNFEAVRAYFRNPGASSRPAATEMPDLIWPVSSKKITLKIQNRNSQLPVNCQLYKCRWKRPPVPATGRNLVQTWFAPVAANPTGLNDFDRMAPKYVFPATNTQAQTTNVDFLETSVWPEVTPFFSQLWRQFVDVVDVYKFTLGSEDVMNYTFTEQMNGISYNKLDRAFKDDNHVLEGDYAYMLTFQGAPCIAGFQSVPENASQFVPDATRNVGPVSGPALVSMTASVSMTCHFPDPEELLYSGTRSKLYALSSWDGTDTWFNNFYHEYTVLFDPKFRLAARQSPLAKFDVAYTDIRPYAPAFQGGGPVGAQSYYVRVATGDTLQDASAI